MPSTIARMNPIEFLCYAAAAILTSVGLWAFIFCTPLIPSLLSWMIPNIYTRYDVESMLAEQQRWWLLKLYTCVWCQAWWTSCLAAVLHGVTFGPLYNTPIYALSFSPVIYLITWKLHHLPNQ